MAVSICHFILIAGMCFLALVSCASSSFTRSAIVSNSKVADGNLIPGEGSSFVIIIRRGSGTPPIFDVILLEITEDLLKFGECIDISRLNLFRYRLEAKVNPLHSKKTEGEITLYIHSNSEFEIKIEAHIELSDGTTKTVAEVFGTNVFRLRQFDNPEMLRDSGFLFP